MKRFQINVINPKLFAAAEEAERLLHGSSRMMLDLAYKSDWQYTPKLYGIDLIAELIKPRDVINVFTYKPFYWRSKVVAYFDGKAIYFNARKLDQLTRIEMIGTLLHEYAHYCGFTHGNNIPTENKKLFSVPYYLSENVRIWTA